MILGSDCVAYLDDELTACAAPATFVRMDGDQLIAVVCARHARTGDQPIAATVERAPSSEYLIHAAARFRARMQRHG